jgi:hypothetical protein
LHNFIGVTRQPFFVVAERSEGLFQVTKLWLRRANVARQAALCNWLLLRGSNLRGTCETTLSDSEAAALSRAHHPLRFAKEELFQFPNAKAECFVPPEADVLKNTDVAPFRFTSAICVSLPDS